MLDDTNSLDGAHIPFGISARTIINMLTVEDKAKQLRLNNVLIFIMIVHYSIFIKVLYSNKQSGLQFRGSAYNFTVLAIKGCESE